MTYERCVAKLQEFCKGAKDVSSGIGKIAPYVTALAVGSLAGGATLTIATLVVLACGATEGATTVIAAIADPKKKMRAMRVSDRFELSYHLLCQQAYAQALSEHLPKVDDRIRLAAIDLSALGDPTPGPIEAARTPWDYDLRLDVSPIPLFDACGKRLSFFLECAGATAKEASQVTAAIDRRAREYARLHLSTKEPPYDWIYNFVQFNNLERVRAATDSLPENIRRAVEEAARGFVDGAKTVAGAKRAWADYRKYLQDLPSKDMFGSPFGVRDLYVLPNFTHYRQGTRVAHRESTADHGERPPLRRNLPVFLTQLVSNRSPRENLVFLFGDPGVGKTSFAQVYAEALSRLEEFHPVYIPLQYIDPNGELIDEIERYLRESPLRVAVDELHNCSNVVFILDAFDELAQATRDSLGDFFRRLEKFAQDQLYRNAAVVVTGRDTLFTKNDTLIPSGTHVITLQPFDVTQIAEWSHKWNKLAKQQFDGTRFWQDDLRQRTDLHDLATQPLLLYLLAKLEEGKQPIDPQKLNGSRSTVYRHIIQWVCSRQQEKTPGRSDTSMSSSQMRKLLRLTGFAMMSRGRKGIHLDDLRYLLSESGLSEEMVQNKSNYKAERTFLMFAFTKTGQAAWEFKHKQFGEYLAAEYIADRVDVICQQMADPDETGTKLWSMKGEALIGEWTKLFGRNAVPPEVQQFLEPMLGCWPAFRGGTVEPSDRIRGLRILLKRCGMVYGRLARESDMKSVADYADQAMLPATRVLANDLISVLAIGSAVARSLSTRSSPAYFSLDEECPGCWYKVLNLIHSHESFPETLAERLLRGTCVDGPKNVTFPTGYVPGVFLPFVRVPAVQAMDGAWLSIPGALFYGSDLSRAEIRHVQAMGANFARADLQGIQSERFHADGANFVSARLVEAQLADARLRGARFISADLTRANLAGANLEGCDFTGAKLDGCILRKAKLQGATFSRAAHDHLKAQGFAEPSASGIRFDEDRREATSGEEEDEDAAALATAKA